MAIFNSFHAKLTQRRPYACRKHSLPYLLTVLLSILICFSQLSCTGEQSLKHFYYPVKNFQKGVVYEYHSVGDSLPPYYYVLTYNPDSSILSGWYLDPFFVPLHYFQEKIVESGSLAKKFNFYQYDSLGRQVIIPSIVEHKNAFPFLAPDTSVVYIYRIKWYESPDSSKHTTLIRNRSFKGIEEHSNQKSLARFAIKERIDQYDEGYLEYETNGEEWYEKDKGLVRYYKVIGDQYKMEYELKIIHTLSEFEKSNDLKLDEILFAGETGPPTQ